MHTRTYSVYVIITVSLLLSGCISYGRVVSHDAIQYNKAYERFSNEQILLNIIRGSYHRPMKFTTISEISGSLGVTVGADISVPFGSSTTRGSTVEPSLSVEKNPSFTMGIQNRDKEFVQGILSPLDGQIVDYFIDQGWKTQQLIPLIVERIEIDVASNSDARPKTITLRNNPDNWSLDGLTSCGSVEDLPDALTVLDSDSDKATLAISAYGLSVEPSSGEALANSTEGSDVTEKQNRELCGFLLLARKIGSDVSMRSSRSAFGPEFRFSGAAKDTKGAAKLLEQLVNARDKNLGVGCWKGAGKEELAPAGDCKSLTHGVQLFTSGDALSIKREKLKKVFEESLPKLNCYIDESKPNKDTCRIKLFLRSPQSIIFYLGEIAHMQRKHKNTICFTKEDAVQLASVKDCGDREKETYHLFRVQRTPIPPLRATTSTRYLGAWHFVPEYRDDRSESNTVLGLVDYLIGLYQKAENLPVTRRVNIIGN